MFGKYPRRAPRQPMGVMHSHPHPVYHHEHPRAAHPQQTWSPPNRTRQKKPFQPGPRPRPLQENFKKQQRPKMQTKGFFTAPFTDHKGKFDISRTANTVDQLVKTVQQVSPYVAQVGKFFRK